MKLSDTIDRVITLAAARCAYWARELPKRHPDYPLIRLAEGSGPPPPEQEELREFLMGLPAATIYMLTFIMYMGRGDIGVENLMATYEEVSDRFNKPASAVEQMLGKAPLADYLSNGLRHLCEAKLDVDRLLES